MLRFCVRYLCPHDNLLHDDNIGISHDGVELRAQEVALTLSAQQHVPPLTSAAETLSAKALELTVDEWRVLPPHLPAAFSSIEPATERAIGIWEKHCGNDLEAALASGAVHCEAWAQPEADTREV